MASTNRRQEYAANTRAAIVQAGRELFAEQGFFAVRVKQIAERARVSEATVYNSVGGKHAILLDLVEQLSSWQPRESAFEAIGQAGTAREVLVALARGTRQTREHWEDVMRVITETAPHDAEIAQAQRVRYTRYQHALDRVAERLHRLQADPPSEKTIAEALWFYFGPTSYMPLRDDLGWNFERCERWLLEQSSQALGIRA